MAKEVARTGPVESMRVADADRRVTADRLQAALDEGRLSLAEYDDRVKEAWAARTYGELSVLVTDLPMPGLTAADVAAREEAERRRRLRRMPTALSVLWTIWGALAAINLVVWLLVVLTTDNGLYEIYPWPIWLLVPGAALGAVTVGVQRMRRRQ